MTASPLEETLRAVFAPLADIPPTEWNHFWSHVRERHFAARQHLILEGRKAPGIHYIVSGVVRMYHNQDGREIVRGFDFAGRWVTAYESVLTGEPALFSAQALEPTHTLCFSGELLQTLYTRHPCWDRFGRRILESQWVWQSDKEYRFRVHSPEAHYRLLVARGSPLIDRVPLNQLANFLQITPETLSRIRARIRDELAQTEPPNSAT